MFMYFAVILLLSFAVDANGVQCCKNNFFKQPAMNQTTECHQLAKPPSCEFDICLAKKLGLLNDDGKMDKNKVHEHYTKTYGIDPISNDAVVTNCINGDFSKYGKEDYCELSKLRVCIIVQMIKTCPEWSNEGECEGVEEKVKKEYF